jgi:hypothetical protein
MALKGREKLKAGKVRGAFFENYNIQTDIIEDAWKGGNPAYLGSH